MPAPEHTAAPHAARPGRPRAGVVGGVLAAAADRLVERRLSVLGGLLVVHWVAIALLARAIPHNGWVFYQGGDQIWLTTTGWLLAEGQLAPTYVGYGWPLVLAPITAVTGPGFASAMPAVIALGALVLAPIALWAVYRLAARIAGAAFGLFAAAAWVAAPFAVIPLWRDDYHERWVEQFLPQALGLTALADYVSLVLALAAALLFVRAFDSHTGVDAVAAGVVAGFLVGTKPSNVLFLAGPALALIVAWRPRLALTYAAGLVPAVLTLALWKARGLGSLPVLAFPEQHLATAAIPGLPALERYVDLDWANFHRNMNDLREYFWSARLLQWLPLAGLVAVARRSPPLAALLGGWLASFVLVKGTTPLSSVSSGSFFRYLMPAYPAYFLLAVSTVLLVPTLGRRVSVRWPSEPVHAMGTRRLALLVAALALVPLAVVVVARPIAEPRAVFVSNILTPVDARIDVRVERDGDARVVTWEHPPVGSARIFYHVFRTSPDGRDLECRGHRGARDCLLEMVSLGATRERLVHDDDASPDASYRVGIAANWVDSVEEGDVFLLSESATAEP